MSRNKRKTDAANRNVARNAAIVVLLIGLVIFAFSYHRLSGKAENVQEERDKYEASYRSTQSQLDRKVVQYDNLMQDYNTDKADWAAQKKKYKNRTKADSTKLRRLEADLKSMYNLARGSGSPSVRAAIDSLERKRDELELSYQVQQNLRDSIIQLEKEADKNLRYFETIRQIDREIHKLWREMTKNEPSFNPGDMTEGDSFIRDSISQRIGATLENINTTRRGLIRAKNIAEHFEISKDSIDTIMTRIDTLNLEFKADIAETLADLEIVEKRVQDKKILLNARYILVGSTRELANKGVFIDKRDNQPFDPKKKIRQKNIKFVPSAINKEDCIKIDLSETQIELPIDYNKLVKSGRIYPVRDGESYTPKKSREPSLSILEIEDRKAFWQESVFLVIETE